MNTHHYENYDPLSGAGRLYCTEMPIVSHVIMLMESNAFAFLNSSEMLRVSQNISICPTVMLPFELRHYTRLHNVIMLLMAC